MLEIKIFDKINSDFKDYYEKFYDRNSFHYFYNFYWIKKTESILKEKHISFKYIFIFDNKKLILVLLLQIRQNKSIRVLEWFGLDLLEFHYPLIDKDLIIDKIFFIKVWKLILSKIKNVDLIYLKKQPGKFILGYYNPFIEYLNPISKKKILYVDKKINNSWLEYYNNSFSSKHRYNHNRSLKQLKKLGSVDFKIANSSSKKSEVLDLISNNKFKKDDNNYLKIFFSSKNLIKSNSIIRNQDKIELYYLTLNNEIISAAVCFVDHDTMYYGIPFYFNSNQLKKISTGNLLLKFIIQNFYKKDLRYFNFGDGDESYKFNWSNNKTVVTENIFIRTIKGFCVYLYLKLFKFYEKIK